MTYHEWFEGVVECGWTCGIYNPIEILANWLRTMLPVIPYEEPIPIEYITQYMEDVTTLDLVLTRTPTREECIEHFNSHYKDGRMDFGEYLNEKTV